jgi:hypothetical protein
MRKLPIMRMSRQPARIQMHLKKVPIDKPIQGNYLLLLKQT